MQMLRGRGAARPDEAISLFQEKTLKVLETFRVFTYIIGTLRGFATNAGNDIQHKVSGSDQYGGPSRF